MTIEALKKEIISVIEESTETEVALTEETHIVNDMGLSSIEAMMLISDLDHHFGINIPSTLLRDVRTVGDLMQVVVDTLLS